MPPSTVPLGGCGIRAMCQKRLEDSAVLAHEGLVQGTRVIDLKESEAQLCRKVAVGVPESGLLARATTASWNAMFALPTRCQSSAARCASPSAIASLLRCTAGCSGSDWRRMVHSSVRRAR